MNKASVALPYFCSTHLNHNLSQFERKAIHMYMILDLEARKIYDGTYIYKSWCNILHTRRYNVV